MFIRLEQVFEFARQILRYILTALGPKVFQPPFGITPYNLPIQGLDFIGMSSKPISYLWPLAVLALLVVGLRGALLSALILWILFLAIAGGAFLVSSGAMNASKKLNVHIPHSLKNKIERFRKNISRTIDKNSLKIFILCVLLLIWQWDHILPYERASEHLFGDMWATFWFGLLGLFFPPIQLMRSLIVVGVGWLSFCFREDRELFRGSIRMTVVDNS